MGDISIQRRHQLSQPEIHEMAEKMVQSLRDKHGGSHCWQGDNCVNYKYSGIDANVIFDDQKLNVDVKLGFLMMGLKGMLEGEINNYLDKHLS